MWIILGLLVAVGTSIQDILNKKAAAQTDLYVVVWGWWFFAMPFLWLGVLVQGFEIKDPSFWAILAVDTLTSAFAVIYYVKALNSSDLSLSVPMLSVTPVLLLLTSFVMLGEFPSRLGLCGVLCIVAGSYLLNFKDYKHGILAPFKSLVDHKGPRYMLVVAALFSIGANLDKMATLRANYTTWLAMLTTCLSVVLTIIMFAKTSRPFDQVARNWKPLLLIGAVMAATYIVQLAAITMTIVPYLIAVKRLSILCSALYGFAYLKEEGIKERLPGISIMLMGVFLIAFS